jgi:hypothetical protein
MSDVQWVWFDTHRRYPQETDSAGDCKAERGSTAVGRSGSIAALAVMLSVLPTEESLGFTADNIICEAGYRSLSNKA